MFSSALPRFFAAIALSTCLACATGRPIDQRQATGTIFMVQGTGAIVTGVAGTFVEIATAAPADPSLAPYLVTAGIGLTTLLVGWLVYESGGVVDDRRVEHAQRDAALRERPEVSERPDRIRPDPKPAPKAAPEPPRRKPLVSTSTAT